MCCRTHACLCSATRPVASHRAQARVHAPMREGTRMEALSACKFPMPPSWRASRPPAAARSTRVCRHASDRPGGGYEVRGMAACCVCCCPGSAASSMRRLREEETELSTRNGVGNGGSWVAAPASRRRPGKVDNRDPCGLHSCSEDPHKPPFLGRGLRATRKSASGHLRDDSGQWSGSSPVR